MSLERRLLALLAHERADLRLATALVLGEAGQGHSGVVKALLARVSEREPAVRRQVLDALAQLAPFPAAVAKTALAVLTPLCGSADADLSGRALRLVAAQPGSEAVLESLLADASAPGPARLGTVGLLTAAGRDAALLEALGDPVVGEHVLQALRARLDAEPKASLRAKLGERAERALAKLGKQAAPARRGALLRLIGYLGEERTLPLLLTMATADAPVELRVSALAAMRRALAHGKPHPKVVAALLSLVEVDDLELAHAAIDTLAVATIPESMTDRLAALAVAKHPEARRLAASRLGQRAAQAALPALVHAVVTGDPAAQQAATRSLAKTAGAAPALLRALLELAPEAHDEARRLAAALRPQEAAIASDAALVTRGERALARGDADRAGQVVLEVLARVAPSRYAELVLGRARKLRKQGDVAAAWRVLRPILGRKTDVSAEDRWFAAMCGLVAEGKSLLRAARTVDPVLVTLRELAREGFPVAKRLGKAIASSPAGKGDVTEDEVFVVGFNLVESQGKDHQLDEDDSALGEELLEAIIAAKPRGKVALAARNKLALARRE
jgi:HEAT repeats